MKKIVFAFSTLFLFFACNENSIEIKSQKSNLTSAVAAGSQNEAELNASLKEIKYVNTIKESGVELYDFDAVNDLVL